MGGDWNGNSLACKGYWVWGTTIRRRHLNLSLSASHMTVQLYNITNSRVKRLVRQYSKYTQSFNQQL